MEKKISIDEALKLNYDNYYNNDEQYWRYIGSVCKVKNIIELTSNLTIKNAIEVGFGDGVILNELSKHYPQVDFYGVEISQSGIEKTKERNIPNLREIKHFDGYNIPYKDKEFDILILSHVLEHVEYPRLLLKEILRVSKYIFIEVPLEDTHKAPMNYVFNKTGHINHYNERTIRYLLQSTNLEVIKQIVTNPSKENFKYVLGKRGIVSFYAHEYGLKLFPKYAKSRWVYHSALLCNEKKNH